MKFRVKPYQYPGLLLPAVFLLIAGCSNDREGVLVMHWITCEKSEEGKWVSADLLFSDRFDVVNESRYQVSFASQRVVSYTGIELTNCTVYDRRNWTCNNNDGSLFMVKNGGRLLGCSKVSGRCFIPMDLIGRAWILFWGVDEAERLCNLYSESFDVF